MAEVAAGGSAENFSLSCIQALKIGGGVYLFKGEDLQSNLVINGHFVILLSDSSVVTMH